jgi:hypothetical protein
MSTECFLTLFRDDLDSNLGKDTGHCNRSFIKFVTVSLYNFGTLSQIKLKVFFQYMFQFIVTIILSLDLKGLGSWLPLQWSTYMQTLHYQGSRHETVPIILKYFNRKKAARTSSPYFLKPQKIEKRNETEQKNERSCVTHYADGEKECRILKNSSQCPHVLLV